MRSNYGKAPFSSSFLLGEQKKWTKIAEGKNPLNTISTIIFHNPQ
jgi:hypothetical protein